MIVGDLNARGEIVGHENRQTNAARQALGAVTEPERQGVCCELLKEAVRHGRDVPTRERVTSTRTPRRCHGGGLYRRPGQIV